MNSPDESIGTFNGLLICQLLDLDAREAMEEIRRMFAKNCVDISCAGDLEEVEIELGFRTERTTPRHTFTPYTRNISKTGRNDPCPCGSGKKFKKCCLHLNKSGK